MNRGRPLAGGPGSIAGQLVVATLVLVGLLRALLIDLAANLAAEVGRRVHVRVHRASAKRRNELGELTRCDTLAARPDHLRGADLTGDRTARLRARGRTCGTWVGGATAQPRADPAIDRTPPQVEVGLPDVATLQRCVRERVPDDVAVELRLEAAVPRGGERHDLLIPVQPIGVEPVLVVS